MGADRCAQNGVMTSSGMVVYPGHGDDTTLGTERPHLREWEERGW